MADRILIVQLADIGDLIVSTPALAALRAARPDAHITLLTSVHAAPVVEGMGLVNEIVTFDKTTFNSSTSLFRPGSLRRILALGRYDVVVFFHHFTLWLGTLKFALIALATRAKRRVGLDNGNGWFLTDRLPDGGFGAKHQAQYWLDLVGVFGADTSPRPAVVRKEELKVKSLKLKELPVTSYQLPERGKGKGERRKLKAEEAAETETGRSQLETRNSKLITRNSKLETENSALSTQHSALSIAVHPGSGGYSLARRWEAANFAAVADALAAEYGAQIVLVGGRGDDTDAVKAAMKNEPLDLSGQTSLPQLAGVLGQCDLFIGADSGVMHLAAAAGVPVVAVFGPSNADAWHPWQPGGKVAVVRSAPECSPCSYVGQGVGLREGCAARTCMRMVTPAMVLRAARQILSGEFVGARHASPLQDPALPRRISILGLPVDAITYAEWLDLIEAWVNPPHPNPSPPAERGNVDHLLLPLHRMERGTGGEVKTVSSAIFPRHEGEGLGARARHVCTINPEFMMIAQKDVNFANILRRADLCVPDGVGLLWAARRRGPPLPERVTGSDGVPIIAARAAEKGWKLFFLGAGPGVGQKAADILTAQHPGLQIVGVYGGSPAPEEEDAIVERVNASGADILFVAYGAPEQDKWIARNLPRLRVRMAMGVGGSFDFIAGIIPRAPEWMRRAGLEWLYRLYLQPWRIRRMTRLPRFVLAVLRTTQ
jgi:N-acetylglucosaminyldiphosphoundecaprenol N-acetyl-beta-D-mannosaminyltransferase